MSLDFTHYPDIHVLANQQVALKGSALRLFQSWDQIIQKVAGEIQAEHFQFPSFLPAEPLHRLDYFSSFPHYVSFPVRLPQDQESLQEFTQGKKFSNGQVQLLKTEPIREVLTPAACYHFYIALAGTALTHSSFMTTQCSCFRNETHFLPLRRQWNFSMREIVCLGTAEEIEQFAEKMSTRFTDIFSELGLPIEWTTATDVFFNPKNNPKYLAQKIRPLKKEMIYQKGDPLSLGSINLHQDYFGETFEISRNGKPAHSACIAFGLERWVYALLNEFGKEAESRLRKIS